jgi:demethylmenaquinone methyltransferase/2-methoxy-6-polyprenyl-1,4-benzoquinol methylase
MCGMTTRLREPVLPAYATDADRYDDRTRVFQHFRQEIVDALPLCAGDVVLDVGCGTGLCFEALVERVGPTGRVIGIDAAPDMVTVARQRVAGAGWTNVELHDAPVADVHLEVAADAALFCAVHDIMQSPRALRTVLAQVKPGGWVAAGGGKWADSWLIGLNYQVRALHEPYVTDFDGFDRPWRFLDQFISDLQVHDLAFGTGYVATGRVAGDAAAAGAAPSGS